MVCDGDGEFVGDGEVVAPGHVCHPKEGVDRGSLASPTLRQHSSSKTWLFYVVIDLKGTVHNL